jgi:hypothetical protein
MNKFILFLVPFYGSSLLILTFPVWPADLSRLFVTVHKPACDLLIPGYEEENRELYLAWQREHKSELEMINRLPELQNGTEELAKKIASLSKEQRSKLEEECSRVADLLQTAAPDDPRFASPDRVWALYLQSLQALDRKTAILCLVDKAKLDHLDLFKEATDQQLRDLANSFTDFKIVTAANGYMADGSFLKTGRTFTIKFGRVGRNWKIYYMRSY